jgi:hypothetical protein
MTSEGSFCAVHAVIPAVATCARCGAFACEKCLPPDSTECAACHARRPPAFGAAFALRSSISRGVGALLRTLPVLLIAALGLFVLRTVVIESLIVASRHWPLLDHRLTWMVAAPVLSDLILQVGFASIVFEAVEARLSDAPRDVRRLWQSLPRAAAGALPFLSFLLLELMFSQRLVWHEWPTRRFFGPAGLSPLQRLVGEMCLAPCFAFSLLAVGVARSPGLDLWRTTAKRLQAAPVRLILTAAVFRLLNGFLVEETQMLWIFWWGEPSLDWIPPTPKAVVGPGALFHLLVIGVAAGVYCVAQKQLERRR